MMNAVEIKATLSGGISVTSRVESGEQQITLMRLSAFQREGNAHFSCTLTEWLAIVDAVELLRGMLGEAND